MVKYLAALVAVAVLAATSDGGCKLQQPGDKTPAEPPPPAIILTMTMTSNPSGTYVMVKINAIDHSGLPSVNLETGELYPTQHPYRTPYGHFITHPPSTTATYTMEGFMGGSPGDILGCEFSINGVKIQDTGTPHVSQIEPGELSTMVYCEYEYWPGKVLQP